MILPSYEDWAVNSKEDFYETHEKVVCYACNGEGETECCECGHEKECHECEGVGFFFEHLITGQEVCEFVPSRYKYYRVMMGELSRLARWQGKSPIALMLPFARAYRKENPLVVIYDSQSATYRRREYE
jgi:hypothetical protein